MNTLGRTSPGLRLGRQGRLITCKKILCPHPFISAGKNLHLNNNVIMSSYSQHFKAFSSTPGVLGESAEELDVVVS